MIVSKNQITKGLIRLRGCAGWSASVLFANPRRQVFSPCGPYNLAEYELNVFIQSIGVISLFIWIRHVDIDEVSRSGLTLFSKEGIKFWKKSYVHSMLIYRPSSFTTVNIVFPTKRNSRGEHPAALKFPPAALKLPPPALIFILI